MANAALKEKTTDKAHTENMRATPENGVKCEIDGVWVHSVPKYLQQVHPTVSVTEYQKRFPEARLHSEKLEEAAASRGNIIGLVTTMAERTDTSEELAKVFDLGENKETLNSLGKPIMVTVLGEPPELLKSYQEKIDPKYIYNVDILKSIAMAFEINTPALAWGKHGTGKTTQFEQFCARTNRPSIRVQHTVSTEEAHILGQYVVKSGQTVFEPGPLTFAMKYGLVYIADEYDFALPSVTSVYQPVLEGKRLIIKEAPPEWRVVEPHPNFRFCATGNTNGGGDETGLYQGTQIQNAANYSRFGITVEISYMPKDQEIAVLIAQAGIFKDDAERLVDFAHHVRDLFSKSEISMTISPRELIIAAKIGIMKGGRFKQGISLAFTNRMNSVDRKAVSDFAQRIFAE